MSGPARSRPLTEEELSPCRRRLPGLQIDAAINALFFAGMPAKTVRKLIDRRIA